ncbi:MAG TPA: hypothetical protein VGP68_20085, partial [Gemmataceae bacterium]|nr:hypothetical protein [Gemmataceae bacterium]
MSILACRIVAAVIALGLPIQEQKQDAPNAAVHYCRAIAALPKLGQDEQPLLDDYQTDPLSVESKALLKKAAEVLREAKAGAGIKRCDWGEWSEQELNYTHDRFMPTSQVG